jgi:hypothetical protein
MTVAPDEGSGFARLFAVTPISFDQNQTFLPVAFIDAVYPSTSRARMASP